MLSRKHPLPGFFCTVAKLVDEPVELAEVSAQSPQPEPVLSVVEGCQGRLSYFSPQRSSPMARYPDPAKKISVYRM